MKYLWTEDTGAGLHFWKLVNQLFFDNALVVESKESNQGILYSLTSLNAKEEDEYYIAFDYVPDNQNIRNKYRQLKQLVEKSEAKVIILDMICFEYFKLSKTCTIWPWESNTHAYQIVKHVGSEIIKIKASIN